VKRWEWILVISLTLGALALYSFDLDSYRYSYVGDEWGFYAMAGDIARGKGVSLADMFSEDGVYGDGPKMDSYYQAAVMKLAGVNNFGFRFSSVLAAAASLLPFYVFLRLAFSPGAAAAGTFCLCFSHYFMAWAHNGHNDNHVIFPMVLSLCLFALAHRRGSRCLFALCGLATASSFYTYYTARLTLVLVVLMFLIWRPARRYFLLFILVFAVAVVPLLMNGPEKLWGDVSGRWFGHDDWRVDNQAKKVAGHMLLSLACPVTFEGWGHGYFVAGSLFDPVTTALFVAGLVYSLFRLFAGRAPGSARRASLFLLLGYCVSAVIVGATTPYPRLSVTRQLVLVPLVCAFAGVGAVMAAALTGRLPKHGRSALLALAAAAGGCIIWLNLHRLYVEMPEKNGLHPLCLATKYVRENRGDMRYYYILPEGVSFWAGFQLEAYGLSGRVTVCKPGDVIDDPSCVAPHCEVIVCAVKAEEVREVMERLQERFYTCGPRVIEGPRGGPWRMWGIADIHLISIGKGRPAGET